MKVYRQFKDEGRKVKRLEVSGIPQDSAKYEHILKYQGKKKSVWDSGGVSCWVLVLSLILVQFFTKSAETTVTGKKQ